MSNPTVPSNVAEITAPLILGVLWNWTLGSSSGEDVYSYNFPGDRTLLKLLVYSVFLVETVQTTLTGVDLYYWFVSSFGNLDHLTVHLSGFDVPIIGSVVSLTVQVFFVYRIWVLSGRSSRFLCLLICLCSIVATVAAFYGGVYAFSHNKFANRRITKIIALIWLSGNASADILITGSLLFHLGRRRKEGSGYFSDHAMSRIVRLTIETNALTSTVGIVVLLVVVIFPVNDFTFRTFDSDDSSSYFNVGQDLVLLPISRSWKTVGLICRHLLSHTAADNRRVLLQIFQHTPRLFE
ncbi:hypothetical protein EDB87DRAFT_1689830 [Lactarius vividus]|nr:hypothetical protein EDB87DRAFT_1689830 [Lactarius vividus]